MLHETRELGQSCGLRVLTPQLPGIKDYHVDRSSVQVIGESAKWFAQKTGGPVGVMGLSFSGGLALVAAADPVSPGLQVRPGRRLAGCDGPRRQLLPDGPRAAS